MSTATRFWIVTCKQDGGGEFTNGSETFNAFDDAVTEIYSGNTEDVCRVVFIDLVAQSSRDVTALVLAEISARSIRDNDQPSKELRDMLDGYDLPYHDDEAAEHEARAYAHQVQQDYTSHVRGW